MSLVIDAEMAAALTPEELAAIQEDTPSADELAAMQRIADGAQTDDDGDDSDDGDGTAAPIEGKTSSESVAPAAKPITDDEAYTPRVAPTPTYESRLPADYADKVSLLATEEADLKQKFKGGDIDFDDFELQRGELQSKREELTLARAKAEISKEMTEQTAQKQWESTIDNFIAGAVKEDNGINYRTDTEKQADLDQFVKVLANRDENADKPMAWFLQEAHKRVRALHNMAAIPAKADPATVLKAATDARKPPIGSAPATLAQVPGGDGPGDVASEFADLDALYGEALESAIAKLTPAQREKWVRAK